MGSRCEPAAENGEPVGEPQQTAPVRPGAPHAVVAHMDSQGAVLGAHRDRRMAGTGVLGDVRQRLGDDEIELALEALLSSHS